MSRSVCLVLFCEMSLGLLMVASDVLAVEVSGLDSVVNAEGNLGGLVAHDVVETAMPPVAVPSQLGSQAILSNRLLLTGTLVVVLLGQLSVLFGYLRIDHATRGFYSGRLQSFSAAASVAVLVIGYLFFIAWKI